MVDEGLGVRVGISVRLGVEVGWGVTVWVGVYGLVGVGDGETVSGRVEEMDGNGDALAG